MKFNCQISVKSAFLVFSLSLASFSLNAQGSVDSDGDGIINSIDLDDDNDGILDEYEYAPVFCSSSPSCAVNASLFSVTQGTSVYPSGWTAYGNGGSPDVSQGNWHVFSGQVSSATSLFPYAPSGSYFIYGMSKNGSGSLGGWAPYGEGLQQTLTCLVPGNYYTVSFKGAITTRSAWSPTWTLPTKANFVLLRDGSQVAISQDINLEAQAQTITLTFMAVSTTHTIAIAHVNPLSTDLSLMVIQAGSGTFCNGIVSATNDIDTDGDGIPNRLDRDSDGDGCSDAFEGGATLVKTDSLMTAPFGANGFADNKEIVAGNSQPNFINTYNIYAKNSSRNACLDSDGDGVVDIYDIDDDNDGIKDIDEAGNCISPDNTLDQLMENSNVFANCAGNIDGPGLDFYGFTLPAYTGSKYLGLHYGEAASAPIPSSSPTRIGIPYKVRLATANASINAWNSDYPTQMDVYAGTASCAQSLLIGTTTLIPAPGPTGSVSTWYLDEFIFTPSVNYTHLTFIPKQAPASSNFGYMLLDGIELGYYTSTSVCDSLNDVDNDGITNELDLDSDGDGCTDAFEGGSSSIPSDSIISGPYGSNGLANSKETAVDNGSINYTLQYSSFAVSKNVATCKDFDNDGVLDLADIDDDNDGIPDAIESPGCFYTANDWLQGNRTHINASTSLAMNTTYRNLTNLEDGDKGNTTASYAVQFVASTVSQQTVYAFDMTMPIEISKIYLGYVNTNTHFNASTFLKLQGSNDNRTWTNLNDSIAYSTTTATNGVTSILNVGTVNANVFNVTKNSGKYRYYRIYWTNGGGINVNGISNEIYFEVPTGYQASLNPEPTCTNDIDNDGKYNHFDLDSDGDGCSDAKEAGATTSSTSNYVFTGAVGSNGLVNSLETSVDNGSINYTSYYSNATSNFLNGCKDTDNDGIADLIDIDDDNDGIPDEVESSCQSLNLSDLYCDNVFNYTPTTFKSFVLNNHITGKNYLSNGDSVQVTYWGTVQSIYTATKTMTSSAEYCPLSNDSTMIQFLSGAQTHVIRFSKTVINPIINIWSLGASGQNPITVTYTFNTPVKITKSNGALVQSSQNVIYGTEGDGSILLPGTYDSIVFVANTSENWTGMQIMLGKSVTDSPSISSSSISCEDIDTDGDGIPNRLDLDSDGDGCYDTYESGASSLASDSIVMGPYGINGFSNGKETSVDNGLVNYILTYKTFAISKSIAICKDNDGDGILDVNDIDDDNDGILDAIESPSCFYNAEDWLASPKTHINASTEIVTSTVYNNPNMLLDGDNGTAASNYAVQMTTTTGAPKSVYTFDMSVPVEISKIYLGYVNTNTHFNANTFLKLQGSNDNSTWINLNDSMAYSTTTATNGTTSIIGVGTVNANVFSVTKNSNKYRFYRIYWTNGGGFNSNGVSNEVYFEVPSNYNASLNPSLTCSSDADGDGKMNHHDLDSDGDGCSDAKEAGATTSNSSNFQFTGTMGSNGLDNSKETSADNGILNYTPQYSNAIVSILNACIDTDGDGTGDLVDIDDDNDGIPDELECPKLVLTAPNIFGISAYDSVVNRSTKLSYTYNGGSLVGLYDGLQSTYFNIFSTDADRNTAIIDFYLTNVQSVNQFWLWNDWGASGDALKNFEVELYNANGNLVQKMVNTAQNAVNTTTPQVFNFSSPGVGVKRIRLILRNWWSHANNNSQITDIGFGNNESLCDFDNDGLQNSLDLDSDNDGCSDALEAGATTSTIANFVFSGPYGNNGLADVKETSADNGIINYNSNYNNNALSINIALCKDTDNDGVLDINDIDDDNDGIPDNQESPNCYYTSAEWLSGNRSYISVSSPLAMNATYKNPSKLIDGDNGTAATSYSTVFAATTVAPSVVYSFDMFNSVELSRIYLGYVNTNTHFNASTFLKLQGSNDNSTWINLNDSIAYSTTTATNGVTSIIGVGSVNANVFNVTKNSGKYRYYRIYWTNGGGINVNGYSNEVYFEVPSNYNPSLNPKPSCNQDADIDGIFNHLDLDSDGDGCSDAKEAGATTSTTANYKFTGTMGTNGLDNSLETSADNGIINYVLYYNNAIYSKLNGCTDSDGDGISDLIDIDDDNDGVIDDMEMGTCNVDPTCTTFPANNSYGITSSGCLGWTSTNGNFDFIQPYNGKPIFDHQGSANPLYGLMKKTFKTVMNVGYSFTLGLYSGQFTAIDGITPILRAVNTSTGTTIATINLNQTSNTTLNFNALSDSTRIEVGYPTAATTNVGNIYWYPMDLVITTNCGDIDTDGDSIPNRLDKDSDGDGCSDALEAGATTSTIANFVFSGPYGNNGLADVKETSADNGIINYNSNYNNNALSSNIALCKDTDNDGVMDINDIDDDNDGIPDNQESPNCYYTSAEWLSGNRSYVSVSSPLAMNATYKNPSKLIDGDNGTAATSYSTVFAATTVAPSVVYSFDMFNSVELSRIYLGYVNTNTHFNASTFLKLQGSNDNSTWINLNDSIAYSTTTATNGVTSIIGVGTVNANVFNVTKNSGKYRYYRIYWTNGGGINVNGYSNEVYFEVPSSYSQALNPKSTCTNDTDNDGKLNHQDLDSDSDGCSDALETGATSSTVANFSFSGPFGANGLDDSKETAVDNGIINYNSTYTPYTISKNLAACRDTDGDGIMDLVDIDDDNDGVLDATESSSCFFTPSDWLSGNRDFINASSSLAMNATYNRLNLLEDGINGTATSNYAVQFNATTTSPATVYAFDMTVPVQLSRIYLGYINTNTHFNANTFLKLQGSNNNSTWTDLCDSTAYNTTVSLMGSTSIPGVTGTVNNNVFVVQKNAAPYRYYRIYWTNGGGINVNGVTNEVYFETPSNYVASINPKPACFADSDNDGKFNHQDLDSDNDGCFDAYEAGATNIKTDSIFAGPYGTNGLANSKETVADNNIINYTSTYPNYALNSTLRSCIDTDGDGIFDVVDIDDDNDGILDTEESKCTDYSSSCQFFNDPNTMSNNLIVNGGFESGNTGFTSGYAYTPGGSVGCADYFLAPTGWVAAAGSCSGTNAMQLNADCSANQVPFWCQEVDVLPNTSYRFGFSMRHNSVSYVAYNIDNGPLSTPVPTTANWSNKEYIINSGNKTRIKICLFETSKVGGGADFGIDDIYLATNANLYCSGNVDTDGDGIPNSLDLDSDNDGCKDAFEGGSTTSKTDSIIAGPYGINGLANSKETTADNGVINYTSTYDKFATVSSIKSCLDSDGDGTNDIDDIDDDNDGVLDTVECPEPKVPLCFDGSFGNQTLISISSSGCLNTVNASPDLMLPNWSSFAPGTPYSPDSGAFLTFVYLKGSWDESAAFTLSSLTPGKQYRFRFYQMLVGQGANWYDGGNILFKSNNTIIAQSAALPATTSGGAGRSWQYQELPFIATASSMTISISGMTTNPNSAIGARLAMDGFQVVYDGSCDSDGDGISNNLDLDSDGDGCTDAFEAGATTNYLDSIIAGPYGTNGLANSKETMLDNGIINYTSTYSNALNASIKKCLVPDFSGNSGIAGNVLNLCQQVGATRTLTASTTPSGTNGIIKWYTSATGGVGSTSAPVVSLDTAKTISYWASQTVNGEEGPRAEIKVVINPRPSIANNAILGSNIVSKDSVYTHSIQSVANATSYIWTLPNGWKGNSNSNIIIDTAGSSGGYIYVKAVNNGCTSLDSASLQVGIKPLRPTVVSDTIRYCQNDTALVLSASLNPANNGGKLNWYTSQFGGTPDSIAPKPSTIFSGISVYWVSQIVNGVESDRTPIVVIVNPTLAPPTSITGSTTVTANTSYTYKASSVFGAVSYTWTLPNGWTGTSNVDSIVINTNNTISGVISVKANSATCSGYSQSLTIVNNSVTPNNPDISGNTGMVGDSIVYCQRDSAIQLTASLNPANNGGKLKWYTSPTGGVGDTIAPKPSTSIAGTYYYFVSQTVNGIESGRAAIKVVVKPAPNQPNTIVGPTSVSINTAYTYSVASVSGATSYTWTLPNGWTGTSTTNSINVTTDTTIGTISVIAKNGNCSSLSQSLVVTALPNNPLSGVAGDSILYCQNTTATALSANLNPSNNGGKLKWYTSSTGGIGDTMAPTPSTSVAGTTYYYVSQTVNGVESGRTAIKVVVKSAPNQPNAIQGPTSVSPNSAYVFSVGSVSGATSYTWTTPTGWIGTSTTNVLSVTTDTQTSVTIKVTANFGTCKSAPQTLKIGTTPNNPFSGIAGDSIIYCQNAVATQFNASLNPANNGGTLNWYTSAVGGTASATAPTPSTSVSGTTYYYVSQTVNGIESGRTAIKVVVNPILSQPNSIQGTSSVSSNTSYTYSVSAVPGATSYTWTKPNGWTGTSTTNSITLLTDTSSGVITVTANLNNCSSAAQTLTVSQTPNNPSSGVTGDSIVYCQSATANVLSANASMGGTLKWYTSPTGGTGDTIAPTPSTLYPGITYYYVSQTVNGIESGRTAIKVIVKPIPNQPNAISGPTAVSANTNYSYNIGAVTGATSYTWTLPNGWTGTSNTNSININTNSTTSGTISVKANIGSCSSAAQTLSIGGAPADPDLSGNTNLVGDSIVYCQNATALQLVASLNPSNNGGTLNWYTTPTGGTASAIAPTPSTTTAGTYFYYVSQTVGGVESARKAIKVVVKPAPNQPNTIAGPSSVSPNTAYTYLISAVSGATSYTWTLPNGWSGTSNTTSINTTSSSITSGVVSVTANVGGCSSIAQTKVIGTLPNNPSTNMTGDSIVYCQGTSASQLSANLNPSNNGGTLNWYTVASGGTASATAPTPSTLTAGTTMYYVSQTVGGVESNRTTVKVIVNPVPAQASFTAIQPTCSLPKGSITVNAPLSGSYKYSVDSINYTKSTNFININSGSIKVYVLDTITGCFSAISTTINVAPSAPANPTIQITQPTCQSATGSISITAPTGSNYIYSIDSLNYQSNANFTSVAAGSYRVRVKDISANCATDTGTKAIVNSFSGTPSQPGIISGPINPTVGSTVIYSIDTVAGASSYTWTVPSGWNLVSGQNTKSISVVVGSTGGTITVKANNSSGCSSSAQTLDVNKLPAKPIIDPANSNIVGNTITYCQGSVATALKADSTVNGAMIRWYTGTDSTSASNAGAIDTGSIGPIPSTAVGNTQTMYWVSQTVNGEEGIKALIIVKINPTPSQPNAIVGNTVVLAGSSQIYSVNAVPGAASYTWTLPSGWSGTSTTNSITATVGSLGGTIKVKANIGNCSSQEQTLNVNIKPSAVDITSNTNISGNTITYCQGATANPLSATGISGSTLKWYDSDGTTVLSGAPTPSTEFVQIKTYYVSQIVNGVESDKAAIVIKVNAAPSQPNPIQGDTLVTKGSTKTYTVSAVPGATSYTWTLPNGWTGTSTTNSITVVADSVGGTISVKANSANCSSPIQTLTVTVKTNSNNDADGDGIPDDVEKGSGSTPKDTDGDGIPDYQDSDSDNDGIPDSDEDSGCTGISPCNPTDTDGDGIPDYQDTDSDNDGISDNTEKGSGTSPKDTDGDGIPDYRDPDSDGDGIPDSIEKGSGSTPKDTDGDGIPDYLDPDSDGDGIPDAIEDTGCTGTSPCTPTDTDKDGTPDYLDTDSDGDGISDADEDTGCNGTVPCTPSDKDNDGVPNYKDLDSDGDGIPDSVEKGSGNSPQDSDGDGIPNYLDLDSDNDGILDAYENQVCPTAVVLCDTDGDGIPNYIDLDSDGDGKSDVSEAKGTDANNDGKADGTSNADGVPSSAGGGLTPPDTNLDGKTDPYDITGTTDTDGDGISDAVEKGNGTTPKDSDGDGIPDFQDLDSDNDGILDSYENTRCANTTSLCDTDGDGIPNYLDLDSDGDGIRDVTEANGTDTNNDGKADGTVDSKGVPSSAGGGLNPPDTDGDSKSNPYDVDSDGDGINDSVERGSGNTPVDTDGDGKPDYLDTDSDGDGISDSVEKGNGSTPQDTDGDGIPNYLDLDSDNDGILDAYENNVCVPSVALCDVDGDGIPNYMDLDSDNDSIPDVIESNGKDDNGDGKADGVSNSKGIPSSATNGNTPPNTDALGYSDPYDLDSDNDGILDSVEKGSNGSKPRDTDGDGIPDYRDVDSDGDGNTDQGEGEISDCDGDGIPDYLDLDICTDGEFPNYITPNGDGKNDYFVLPKSFTQKYPNAKIVLYNRWGNIVWRSVGTYKNDWNGIHYNNEVLPDGVYYYVIELENEFAKIKTGFVQILRD